VKDTAVLASPAAASSNATFVASFVDKSETCAAFADEFPCTAMNPFSAWRVLKSFKTLFLMSPLDKALPAAVVLPAALTALMYAASARTAQCASVLTSCKAVPDRTDPEASGKDASASANAFPAVPPDISKSL